MYGELPPLYEDVRDVLESVAQKYAQKLTKEAGGSWSPAVEMDCVSAPRIQFVRTDGAVVIDFPLDACSGTMTAHFLNQKEIGSGMLNVASIEDALAVLKKEGCPSCIPKAVP